MQDVKCATDRRAKLKIVGRAGEIEVGLANAIEVTQAERHVIARHILEKALIDGQEHHVCLSNRCSALGKTPQIEPIAWFIRGQNEARDEPRPTAVEEVKQVVSSHNAFRRALIRAAQQVSQDLIEERATVPDKVTNWGRIDLLTRSDVQRKLEVTGLDREAT
jgi:hypothetical protein